METLWFILVSILFIGFAVLDGFDLGVGSIYLLITKNEAERHQVRKSIGPIWGGNEVWLIAAGGTLFFAFPKAYAAILSRFYLGLFILIWFLILRGLSIELRSQLTNGLWRTFWDVIFNLASFSLAGFLGVVMGNLLRGIPIVKQGDPTVPFWTNFLPTGKTGLLDWYTILIGGFILIALVVQGANYLAWKTKGALSERAKRLAWHFVLVLIPYLGIVLAVTPKIQPKLIMHYRSHPIGIVFPALIFLTMVALVFFIRRGLPGRAFAASCFLSLIMLAATAYGIYPNLLLFTTDPSLSLTIYNSATTLRNLQVGLIWFSIGFVLLLAYVTVMYRSFWGKVSATETEQEY